MTTLVFIIIAASLNTYIWWTMHQIWKEGLKEDIMIFRNDGLVSIYEDFETASLSTGISEVALRAAWITRKWQMEDFSRTVMLGGKYGFRYNLTGMWWDGLHSLGSVGDRGIRHMVTEPL